MKTLSLVAAALLMFGVTGCGEGPVSVTRDASAPIQTNRLSYSLVKDGALLVADIPYIFSNQTGEPVFVVNCNGSFGLVLEELEDEGWVTRWSPIRICNPRSPNPPIVIPSDGELSSVLHVSEPVEHTSGLRQSSDGNIRGIFRIRWTSARVSFDVEQQEFGAEVAQEFLVSNSFWLDERD